MGRFFSREGGCEGARTWASLELDGELSQVERVLLAAHLRRCEPCSAFVGELRALTEVMRTAPLEVRERPFVFQTRGPARLDRRLALRVALAATLAALGAALGVLAGSVRQGSDGPVSPPDGDVALITPAFTNPSGTQSSPRREEATKPERLFTPRPVGGNL
jgi:hypothetical protein